MRSQVMSPFFNFAMIKNEEMFFGRKVQLRRLFSSLAHHQSVSILGQRRMGKSSLLWCSSLRAVQERFPLDLSHHIFVFLDLHDYLDKNTDDFFRKVCKEIVSQCERVAELMLQIDDDANAPDAFSDMLDQIAMHGFFPVLLLDSFDKVTQNEHFSPAFFGFLRSQASRGRVSYVTASIAPLHKVCHRSVVDSPFFNIFSSNELEALTSEEAHELITIPAQRAGIPFTEQEIQWIQTLAGRHPFFLQRVCHVLFDEKVQRSEDTSLIHDENWLYHLQELAYNELLSQFEDIWKALSENQQLVLQREARIQEHEKRNLPDLSESMLFRQFVRAISQMGFFDLTVDELESILDIMNKPNELETLGNSPMRLMQTVSQHLNKDAPMSAVERGMAIREVLGDAFERMKASSPRRDAAPEWRYYNILYYRHFKYHLTNEQLTARLGLGSVRTYYRERKDAIKTLLDVLMKMEHLAT